MARAKTTNAEKHQKKVEMLEKAKIEVPCKISSDRLFVKMLRLGFTRYAVVMFILNISHTKGRRMHLAKNCNIEIDSEYKVSITKIVK